MSGSSAIRRTDQTKVKKSGRTKKKQKITDTCGGLGSIQVLGAKKEEIYPLYVTVDEKSVSEAKWYRSPNPEFESNPTGPLTPRTQSTTKLATSSSVEPSVIYAAKTNKSTDIDLGALGAVPTSSVTMEKTKTEDISNRSRAKQSTFVNHSTRVESSANSPLATISARSSAFQSTPVRSTSSSTLQTYTCSGSVVPKSSHQNLNSERVKVSSDLEEDTYWNLVPATRSKTKLSYPCLTCGKVFRAKSEFKKHGFIHKDLRQFVCECCGVGFNSKNSLLGHRRRHYGIKPYKCRFCDLRFIGSGNRNCHERTHTGEKPFVCEYCSRKFALSSSLVRHRRIHTREAPYVCQFCGNGFRQYTGLKSHIVVNHKDSVAEAKVTKVGTKPKLNLAPFSEIKYFCHVCGKSFSEIKDLETHRSSHVKENSERPASCEDKTDNPETDESECCMTRFDTEKDTSMADSNKIMPRTHDYMKQCLNVQADKETETYPISQKQTSSSNISGSTSVKSFRGNDIDVWSPTASTEHSSRKIASPLYTVVPDDPDHHNTGSNTEGFIYASDFGSFVKSYQSRKLAEITPFPVFGVRNERSVYNVDNLPYESVCQSTVSFAQSNEGFPQPPDGFPESPEGFSKPSEGFPQTPDIFSKPPEGFPQPPDGFPKSAEGFSKSTEGFLALSNDYLGVTDETESQPLQESATSTFVKYQSCSYSSRHSGSRSTPSFNTHLYYETDMKLLWTNGIVSAGDTENDNYSAQVMQDARLSAEDYNPTHDSHSFRQQNTPSTNEQCRRLMQVASVPNEDHDNSIHQNSCPYDIHSKDDHCRPLVQDANLPDDRNNNSSYDSQRFCPHFSADTDDHCQVPKPLSSPSDYNATWMYCSENTELMSPSNGIPFNSTVPSIDCFLPQKSDSKNKYDVDVSSSHFPRNAFQ